MSQRTQATLLASFKKLLTEYKKAVCTDDRGCDGQRHADGCYASMTKEYDQAIARAERRET